MSDCPQILIGNVFYVISVSCYCGRSTVKWNSKQLCCASHRIQISSWPHTITKICKSHDRMNVIYQRSCKEKKQNAFDERECFTQVHSCNSYNVCKCNQIEGYIMRILFSYERVKDNKV